MRLILAKLLRTIGAVGARSDDSGTALEIVAQCLLGPRAGPS